MVMVIDTFLGQTRIFTFRPFEADFDRLPGSYGKIKYKKRTKEWVDIY